MAFLMVSNVGEIPLSGIRVLGLSKKEKHQIGQFGTGLKESIALLIRRGKKPIIMAGTTKITFSVQNIEGNDEICFMIEGNGTERFPAGIWHGMGMSPGFGKLDWTSPWQVLREIFCNAYDEGEMKYDLTQTVEGEKGYTRVYLEADTELMEAHKALPEKLLFLNHKKPLDINQHGSILEKGGIKKGRIFTKGVWVQDSNYNSIFDYEIKDLKLNESRSADWHGSWAGMAKVISESPMAVRTLLLEANEKQDKFKELMEGNNFYYFDVYVNQKKHWKAQFHELWGVTAVAICTQHHLELATRKGYKPVQFPEGIYNTLKDLGVPTVSAVTTKEEQEGITITHPSIRATKLYEKIWLKLNNKGLTRGKMQPKLQYFTTVGSEAESLKLGFYRDNTVFINDRISRSREEITTMIEEITHHVTGATDCSRDFQNYLLDVLVTLNF
jgi:hypothetical protein